MCLNPMSEPVLKSNVSPPGTPETQALMGVLALVWRMDEAFGQQQIAVGLGRLECYLLMQLDCPRRMGELAKILMMVPSTVTSAADRLEQEGLALRVRDSQDRRAFQLQLTAKGRSLRNKMKRRAGQRFREICGLNAEEIQQFARLTGKIQKKILGAAAQQPSKET